MSGDSVIEAQQLFQVESGGAIPTSPHQLNLKLVNKLTAKNALSKWHYLGDKGFLSTYNYGVFFGGELVGIITYGIPNAPNLKGIYDQRTQSDYLELTRLALSPNCPKNTASRVIAVSIKLLRKSNPKIKGIITYADTEQNHTGIIYRASNFKYLGLTAQKTDLFVNGEKVGKLKGVKYSELGGNWVKRSRKHLFYKALSHGDRNGLTMVRLSIIGNYCKFCGTKITKQLKCSGCGHIDPPSTSAPTNRKKSE